MTTGLVTKKYFRFYRECILHKAKRSTCFFFLSVCNMQEAPIATAPYPDCPSSMQVPNKTKLHNGLFWSRGIYLYHSGLHYFSSSHLYILYRLTMEPLPLHSIPQLLLFLPHISICGEVRLLPYHMLSNVFLIVLLVCLRLSHDLLKKLLHDDLASFYASFWNSNVISSSIPARGNLHSSYCAHGNWNSLLTF